MLVLKWYGFCKIRFFVFKKSRVVLGRWVVFKFIFIFIYCIYFWFVDMSFWMIFIFVYGFIFLVIFVMVFGFYVWVIFIIIGFDRMFFNSYWN